MKQMMVLKPVSIKFDQCLLKATGDFSEANNLAKIDNSQESRSLSFSLQEQKDIDFHLDDLETDDSILLKGRTDIYYKIYKNARMVAKTIRKNAIIKYLEGKGVKNAKIFCDNKESNEYCEDGEDDDDEDDPEGNDLVEK
jgi:ribonuclease HI